MSNPSFTPQFVDEMLFGRGLAVGDYFLSKTPYSEAILYTGKNGMEYYLSVGSDELAQLMKKRLLELGVRVIET